jgi:hypothetical protein
VVVSNVLAGLPAYDGGLNSGDELISVDGLRIDTSNAARRIIDLRAGQRTSQPGSLSSGSGTRTLMTAAPKPFDRYLISEDKSGQADLNCTPQAVAWRKVTASTFEE